MSNEKNKRNTFDEFLRQRRSLIVILLSLLVLGFLLWTGYHYVIENYTVTRIHVDGNTQYTSQEIIDFVMQGPYGNNSLVLSQRYKNRSIDGIPFIEKIDVTIIERDTIRINVYEKALAGFIEYLGQNLYFDKDGIIVESSTSRHAGIPEVIGLQFDYAVMHESLPVKDPAIFSDILTIRHLLEQYNVPADRISFGDKNEVTLHFEKIRVALGNEGYMDLKIMELENMLSNLTGQSGVLRMENYDEYSLQTIFESD